MLPCDTLRDNSLSRDLKSVFPFLKMRLNFLSIFVVPFALLACGINGAPLNILLVVIDDFGWSDVGFHGTKIATPNMDKLASAKGSSWITIMCNRFVHLQEVLSFREDTQYTQVC